MILTAAGVGAIYIARFRLRLERQQRTERFVSTYAALAVARERYSASPESAAVAFDSIHAANGADSAWMGEFAASLSKDIHRGRSVWEQIVERLDSLRAEPTADTTDAKKTEI